MFAFYTFQRTAKSEWKYGIVIYSVDLYLTSVDCRLYDENLKGTVFAKTAICCINPATKAVPYHLSTTSHSSLEGTKRKWPLNAELVPQMSIRAANCATGAGETVG